ncbi:MAG: glucose-1-phosphate thymidylyltransferase RfbA [Gammaproteobacteria bacterium]|jgi:glucose-1-phosphate thymidylyltransferase|nr:glucose-1-phosphate thymidylyltransferase RfbA [Gammaproteobacteria bacterium]MBT6074948.1 glucose-1-phosphate thymidylyltransferase RfbA [Gammaproteobacteria bacterium]MBT7754523.1 glucose-1-phosphate thymidylyltransferase RfbA [Gammaproteobacteria bacterium]
MKWKGIILAGGTGTRLHPLTYSVSKQILPIYDKPMIYYPLSVLMLAGIRDILIVTTPHDLNSFQKLLGDGSSFGVNIEYKEQSNPDGLPQAFIIAEEFIGEDNVCMILGDNVFYGEGFNNLLSQASLVKDGATIFGYKVNHPEHYGVIEFDDSNKVMSIEEKPLEPKSNIAITGLYFFDRHAAEYSKQLMPSSRGEIEITDLIKTYMEKDQLFVQNFGRGFTWLDTGTHDNLMEAAQFVQIMERRQGIKIACLEEIAYNHNWIDKGSLEKSAKRMMNSEYGKYLESLF